MQKLKKNLSISRQYFLVVLAIVSFLFFNLTPVSVYAVTNKLALIIANSNYDDGTLSYTISDARQLKKVLEDFLCFKEVTIRENLNRRAMKGAINEFVDNLRENSYDSESIGLFYFAGHGAQGNGQHFLLPIDHDIRSQVDLEYEAIPVTQLIKKMTIINTKSLMILDACYDKPYKSQRARSLCHNIISNPIPFSNKGNLMIAYPHTENIKRNRQNLYTQSLIKILKRTLRQRLDINKIFNQVAQNVFQESQQRQRPFYEGKLENFSLDSIDRCDDDKDSPPPLQLCSCCGWAGCYPCPCRFPKK